MKTAALKWLMVNVLLLMGGSWAQAFDMQQVSNGGTIQGQVTFVGSPPAPLRFTVEKNPEICGQERSLVKVDVRNGLLKGAVIVLEGVTAGKPFPVRTFTNMGPGEGAFEYEGGHALGLQIKTKGCNFGPFSGVIAADEEVKFRNEDSIKHTLHTFSSPDKKGMILRTIHNQDLAPQSLTQRTFTKEKLRGSRVIRMTCNRHEFMQNWLYVVDHPYFAITDEHGRFHLDQIPPGTYTLLVWHPVLGEQRQEIHIRGGAHQTLAFRYEEK